MNSRSDKLLTPQQRLALDSFAARNGRRWKSKLCDLWTSGQDWREPEGCWLRQIRNAIGPSGLYRLRLARPEASPPTAGAPPEPPQSPVMAISSPRERQ